MTMHDQWTDRLSGYLDDDLDELERQELSVHLASCADCTSTLDSLREIVGQAASLAPRPPAADLWAGVADQVAMLPVSRRQFFFTRLQLSAAGLVLALFSGWLGMTFLGRINPSTSGASEPDVVPAVSYADVQYDEAVADLEKALEEGQGRLDPSTIAVLEQNLKIIDAAVDEARRAVAADAAGSDLSDYLVAARRHKLDLLRRATALTSESN